MRKRGPDRTGRPFMTGDRDPTKYYPVYHFVRTLSSGRDKAIPVLLITQDPDFTISGKAEIMGFDPKLMDRAVLDMIREERRTAFVAFYYLQSKKNFLEKATGDLRKQARELAIRMQDIREELELAGEEEKLVLEADLQAANQRFGMLVQSSRLYPTAGTTNNPYLQAFLRTGQLNSIKQMTFDIASRCCHHVEVRAKITDEEWLDDPCYQDEDGFTVPKMEILEITATPMHEDYRDALPHVCRGIYGLQHHVGQGKEMYRAWEEFEEATLLSRRRKNKNN